MKKRKISVLSSDEIRLHIFAFSLTAILLEIFYASIIRYIAIPKDSFFLYFMAFFVFYTVIDNLFQIFVAKKASALISLLPAILMFVLLSESENRPFIKYAIITAAVLRLFIVSIPYRKEATVYGCFIFDAVALYLRFAFGRFCSGSLTDKLLFIFLVILTISAFQKSFPFIYFAMIGIIIVFLPISQKPIDWSFWIKMGEQVAEKAQNISYYMPYHIDGNTYSVGYSSFHMKGNKISRSKKSERTQIILETKDKPYFTYRDKDSGKLMKMRRTLYLAGGKGVDKQQLVRYIQFLYDNGVTYNESRMFSQVSKVKVEYNYIKTSDEIAPSSVISMEASGKNIEEGVNDKVHKKGYSIETRYIDIDYGNQYLISLFRNAEMSADKKKLSFEEARDYAKKLYSINLENIVSEVEYKDLAGANTSRDYLETDGCSERLRELADSLTDGVKSDYDKCRKIEEYLRQYPYSLDASGGYDASSDMSTAKGMADIADRFLFDTESGYCVHYASSMVMLLRLAGIPARAERGFYYLFPFEEEDNYKVSGMCAHTWPMAYIENVGWIPFEPTGAYRTFEDYTWHRGDVNVPQAKKVQKKEIEESAVQNEDNSGKMAAEAFNIAIPVAVSIAVLLILIIVGSFFARTIHYRYAGAEEKLRLDVEQIKKSLEKKNKDKFIDRGLLSDYLCMAPKEMQSDLRVVFEAYYRSIYGNDGSKKIQREESELAKSIRENLR